MGDMADYYLEQCLDHDDFDSDLDGEPMDCRIKPVGPGKCPRCQADTVLRTGIYGKFYGCSTFPHCKGSRNYL